MKTAFAIVLRPILMFMLCGVTLLSATPGRAADDVRQSVIQNINLMPVTDFRRSVRCDPGAYLVGVGMNFTDRMLGYWFKCAGKYRDGTWAANSTTVRLGHGQVRRNATRWHD